MSSHDTHEPLTSMAASVPAHAHAAGRARSFEMLRMVGVSRKQRGDVADACDAAAAAGVSWFQIIATLAPFILSILTGGTIDIAAIIAAILSLIRPPAPTPAPNPTT